MNYCEVSLTPETEKILLKMSADWSAENSCRGYYANDELDLKGNRFFSRWITIHLSATSLGSCSVRRRPPPL